MKNQDINILVVDDEADIRKILRLLLSKKGYNVTEAANGAEAVEEARLCNFDLIIMDIMMPRLDGIEATARIREFSVVPVLFLTAKSLDRDKEAAYLSGGDDYLVKPFSSTELMLKIESLLRRYTVYRGKESEDESTVTLPCGIEADLLHKTVKKRGESVTLRERESEIFPLPLRVPKRERTPILWR